MLRKNETMPRKNGTMLCKNGTMPCKNGSMPCKNGTMLHIYCKIGTIFIINRTIFFSDSIERSLKGRVQAKRAFFSFLDLKTSFLAYICILGQIKKNAKKKIFDHFWRPYWKKRPQISGQTRARARGPRAFNLRAIG